MKPGVAYWWAWELEDWSCICMALCFCLEAASGVRSILVPKDGAWTPRGIELIERDTTKGH